jgi:hypothetical protein
MRSAHVLQDKNYSVEAAGRKSVFETAGWFGVFAAASSRACFSKRQKSFLLVVCLVPSLLPGLGSDLYSTSSRSNRTMRIYSPPFFQICP